jgi:hypothetical protein
LQSRISSIPSQIDSTLCCNHKLKHLEKLVYDWQIANKKTDGVKLKWLSQTMEQNKKQTYCLDHLTLMSELKMMWHYWTCSMNVMTICLENILYNFAYINHQASDSYPDLGLLETFSKLFADGFKTCVMIFTV